MSRSDSASEATAGAEAETTADSTIDWLADRVLEALTQGHVVAPTALRLLVRRFASTGREDLGGALGPALADVLETPATPTTPSTAETLLLLIEALDISADEALGEAVTYRAAELRRAWPSRGTVSEAMPGLTACLAAAQLGPDAGLAGAIDELERIVGIIYEPGDGVAREIRAGAARGGLADHAEVASTLLYAYATTGRVPYAMLAEELMQVARRAWWDEGSADLAEGPEGLEGVEVLVAPAVRADEPPVGFAVSCTLVTVLCRLAVLRTTADYRETVAAAAHTDYGTWASHLIHGLASSYRPLGHVAAGYGLALDEWVRWRRTERETSL